MLTLCSVWVITPQCSDGTLYCCKPDASQPVCPPPPSRGQMALLKRQELSLACVAATSRTRHTGGSTPCADDLNIFPATSRTRHTGGSTPCADDLNIFPATSRTRHTGGSTPCADDLNIFPPSPHVLEFTENSCNVICTKK